MKTHIMIALTALVISACASKRDIASTKGEEELNEELEQHALRLDTAGSRIK